MLKVVLKLDLQDDKKTKKAMKIASGFAGVDWVSIDMKDMKLMTVAGDVDPVMLTTKLRKLVHTEIFSVRQAKRAHPPPLYNYGRYVDSLNDLAS